MSAPRVALRIISQLFLFAIMFMCMNTFQQFIMTTRYPCTSKVNYLNIVLVEFKTNWLVWKYECLSNSIVVYLIVKY